MLERIVSLEPSVTATLIALGQRHRLVAVTRYCSRLADVEGIPQLETTWSVKANDVAALKPDIVIAATPYQAGKVDELLKAKLNVLCLYPNTLNDVYNHVIWLGRLCDASSKAETIVSEIKDTLADLQKQAAGKPKLRVYVENWPQPMMNTVPWIAEMVELLGGEVVPAPPHGRQVTEQEVMEADPQLIILNWAGMDTDKMDRGKVLGRKGWEDMSAIRSERVVIVNEIFLNAPGPNLAEGGRELYRAMYEEEHNAFLHKDR